MTSSTYTNPLASKAPAGTDNLALHADLARLHHLYSDDEIRSMYPGVFDHLLTAGKRPRARSGGADVHGQAICHV